MKKKWVRFIRQVGGGIVFPLAICLFFAVLLSPRIAPALDSAALPTGGTITSGSGSISTSGSRMTVNQTTQKLVADWDTFNIGQDASVTFSQPDASASALNRIHDQNPSQILGSLNANGRVFLVNPSGIIFGHSAQVNVGGLVASSLNITDEDFLSGNYTFASNGSAGSISNAGTIDAEGGYVAFLAPVIENTGTVTADSGTLAMAAGNKISLDFAGDGLITFTIDQGAVDARVTNKGLIRADGGLVYLSAEAADELTRAAVNNEGIIQAQTLAEVEGRILLLADMETGTVQLGGTLDASAPDGGDGGFIETSAATVTIADDVTVTTAAPDGETGTWLIDPTDYTIAASGGDMTGAALTTALASTDVTIETADAGADAGNIYVNDNISWSANTLTLDADNDIEINSEMTATGTAGLELVYIGDYTINAPVNLASSCSFSANGTPYTIITTLGSAGSATGTDLQGINGNLSGNYVLGSDINASATSGWNGGAGFDPIGDNATRFTGTFDGLGHTVSNLTINSVSLYTGLFGFAHGAAIRNTGVTGGSITGTANLTGGLVGFLYYASISDSYVTAKVSGAYGTGGLVGRSEGSTITECYSTGNVTGGTSTGGLIGIANLDTITESYASGTVQGTGNVGGLVGIAAATDISDSYFTENAGGSVTGTGSYTGGLVGDLNSSTISNSYVSADVTGGYCTGGLVAYSTESTISRSYATGDVEGTGTVGGFAAIVEDSGITESYASGNVTGSSTVVGGFAGYLTAISGATASISNCYATGDVEGLRSVGGLVGLMGNRINLSQPSSDIDGGSCMIDNSYATGSVTGTDPIPGSFFGGLVGYSGALILDESDGLNISNTICTITNSYAAGDVEGIDYVGGLAGYSGAFIGSGSDSAGISSISSTIKNSYAGGTVTGTGSNVGDFLGYSGNVVDPTCVGSAITGSSSEVQDKDGSAVVDFTSFVLNSEQKNLDFYQTTLDWGVDIDDDGWTGTIWRIYESNTFPLLRNFLTQTSATAVTKVYDGTTSLDSASISWTPGTDETLIYGTASSSGSEINAGSYILTLSGLYSIQQGYDILANGTLTITPASLTITASDDSKYYDGTAYSGGNGVTYSGFINGEDVSVLSGVLTYSGTSQGATTAGTYVITASGLASGNYNITFVDGELIIQADNQPEDENKRQPSYPQPDAAVPKKEDSGSLLDVDEAIAQDYETTTLATESSLLVIEFEYSPGGTVTLLCGGAATSELRGVIDALPVFLDEGGSRFFVGNYAVRESPGTVSLKRLDEGQPYEEVSAMVQAIRATRPFNLTEKNGKSAEFTVGVTKDGVVFVSRSDGDIRLMDRDQVVLMALQTIKQDMGVDLKDIRGLVIVSGGGDWQQPAF